MALNKKSTVREIGRRTNMRNRDVQLMLETLIDVWTEELVAGGKIEIENFLVLETITVDLGENRGVLNHSDSPRFLRKVTLRASKQLKHQLILNSSVNKIQ